MNYLSLHDYFKTISENLSVTTQWIHNFPEQLQLYEKDTPLTLLSLPFTSSGIVTPNYQETWVANFVFYQQDQADGSLDQNNQADLQESVKILGLTEQSASEFLRLADFNEISADMERNSELLNIVSFTKGNAIRDNSVMTGTTLTINFTVADSFDYCCNPNFIS